MNDKIDELMRLADNYAAHHRGWLAIEPAYRDEFKQALEDALKPGVNEPSWRDEKLAEMVMSDCGCSTNDTRLLERITNRIAAHMSAPPAQPPCKWPACQSEEYQHRLANDVATELIGAPPRLTEAEVNDLYDKWVKGKRNGLSFTDVFQDAVRRQFGVTDDPT